METLAKTLTAIVTRCEQQSAAACSTTASTAASEKSSARSSADAAAGIIADATTAAAGLLAEISRRWPGQARSWAGDVEIVASWGRGIAEAKAQACELRAALAALTARPYPPDLGALLAHIAERGSVSVTETEAYKLLLNTLRALSSGDLSSCSRHELYALKNYPGGSWTLRTETASDQQRKRWRELLIEAARLPADELPAAVAKPASLLVRRMTDEERRRGAEKLAALKAMLREPNNSV